MWRTARYAGLNCEATKLLPKDLIRHTYFCGREEKAQRSLFRHLAQEGSFLGDSVVPVSGPIGLQQAPDPATRTMGIGFMAAFENIPSVDPELITWEQVKQLRADTNSLTRVRNLRVWFVDGLKGESVAQAADILAKRIEDYSFALQKHGVDTLIGSMKTLINWERLAKATGVGSFVALQATPMWALAAGAATLGAEVAIQLAERASVLADVQRGPGSEVAVLMELDARAQKT